MSQIPQNTKKHLALACLFTIVAAFLYININWLIKYRFNQTLDIDEAGYLTYATVYARALQGGGIGAWIHAINGPGAHGPIVPALASIILSVARLDTNYGLLTNSFLSGLLVLLTYRLTKCISDSYAASLAAALVVASTPGIIDYTRNFQFAIQASLCYTVAIIAIIKSNNFTSKRYSAIAGTALGTMIMSRTMTIAFLPAFAFASLILIALGSQLKSRQTWMGAALAILTFAITALTWYAGHYKAVFEYLFSFGYGNHASEYGANTGFLTISNLESRIDALLGLYFKPIHFFLVIPFVAISLPTNLLKKISGKSSEFTINEIFIASLLLSSFLILASSRNRGSGFEVPMIAAAVSLAMAYISNIFSKSPPRQVAFTIIALMVTPVVYSHLSLSSCDQLPKRIWTPFSKDNLAFECRGTIHFYVGNSGVILKGNNEDNSSAPQTREDAIAWSNLSRSVANIIHEQLTPDQGIAYATRNYLFNVNTVSLAQAVLYGRIWPASQIDPNLMEKNMAAYLSWLQTMEARSTCLVAESDASFGEFNPKPSIELIHDALAHEHFVKIKTLDTPAVGQHINIWLNPKCMTKTAPTKPELTEKK